MPSRSDVSDFWSNTLAAIKEKVTPQQFETWFRGIEAGHCDPDTMELSVTSVFKRDWLRTRYIDVIVRAAEQIGGRRPKVTIDIRPGAEGEETPGQDLERLAMEGLRANGSVLRIPEPIEAPREVPTPYLNPQYRFDTFVVGPNSQLPWAAAQTVVEPKGRRYNPIFIHGGVGLGKTHLLQSIAHAAEETSDKTRVLYVPCEHFINHFISAVDAQELEPFRARYRNVDVLVVDDVHLLAQKERSQEEFLHTFNALQGGDKQIILSADAEPGAIPFLSDRLSSRFRGGLVCSLENPDTATRLAIATAKATRMEVEVPDEVLRFVAENVCTNVRELEGALNRVIGHATLADQPVSLELARQVLKDVVSRNRRRVTIEHIAEVVTRAYGVRLAELQGKRRTQAIVVPRQICMYIARRLTGLSLENIGGYFGGRDHSTVLYAVDKTREKAERDPGFRGHLEDLTAEVIRQVDG